MTAVFIGSGPTLTAIDRDDGSTLWTHVTGGAVTADIAVVARDGDRQQPGWLRLCARAVRAEPERNRRKSLIRERGVLLAAGR